MSRSLPSQLSAAVLVGVASWLLKPLPAPDPDAHPILVIVRAQSPVLYGSFQFLSAVGPALVFFIALRVAQAVISVWMQRLVDMRTRGKLPPWPLDPHDEGPAVVIGEMHHKTRYGEASHPKWCVIPEKGLYTGLAIFGAVGTGKTTSCMRPFTRQLLHWQKDSPEKRCAMLLLEVKGDFCYQVQEMLAEYGRMDDYMEITLAEDGWQWNPMHAPWIDSYSLAYTVASVMTQLWGKGKEPFWQQSYVNLMRWIIEIHRSFPDPWFTFADIYHAMLDQEALGELVMRNHRQTFDKYVFTVEIEEHLFVKHEQRIKRIRVTRADVEEAARLPPKPDGTLPYTPSSGLLADGADEGFLDLPDWELARGRYVAKLNDVEFNALGWELSKEPDTVAFSQQKVSAPSGADLLLTKEIGIWYHTEWLRLDQKLRSSIIAGLSVFLGIFVVPETAGIFCPRKPSEMTPAQRERLLPPLDKLIESGKVLALNMPAGANPALARTAGVMLKQAWLSTLLLRPKRMREDEARVREKGGDPFYWRPAVFVCDEYQAFVTSGEDDPGGDERAFALTRQSRCIPIVATQSITSLKAVLGEGEAWRALLQTLRSRIFFSLGDDFSQKTASDLLGQVNRMRASFSLSENTGKASASLLTGKVGGGTASAGISKSYSEKREPLFHPRDLSLLDTCQAVCQIFDGRRVRDAHRVYLKPDFLPRDLPYFRARERGDL